MFAYNYSAVSVLIIFFGQNVVRLEFRSLINSWKLQDDCSKTLTCVLSSCPAEQTSLSSGKGKPINNVWQVWVQPATVSSSLARLRSESWQEASLTLKQFALKDTDEMRTCSISEHFINSWMLWEHLSEYYWPVCCALFSCDVTKHWTR